MVQESTSRPVDGDTAWLSCHRKISGLDSSSAASHTSSSFSSTERQRSTLRAFGWVEEVAAWKRSMPKAHRVKEVMPRDTACVDEHWTVFEGPLSSAGWKTMETSMAQKLLFWATKVLSAIK